MNTYQNFNISRPITLTLEEHNMRTNFIRRKPSSDKQYNIYYHQHLREYDTLYVSVPKYESEDAYWDGTEILIDGQISDKVTACEIPFRDTDSTKVYLFTYDYSEREEGPVKLTARYINDPGSYDEVMNRVIYAEYWETFDNSTVGLNLDYNTTGDWNEGAILGYPHKYHHFIGPTLDGNNVLSATNFDLSNQLTVIKSPSFTVPEDADEPQVMALVYFDYKRDCRVFDGTSSMAAQMYNELANSINPLGTGIIPGTFAEAYLHNTGRGWSVMGVDVEGSGSLKPMGWSDGSGVLVEGVPMNLPNLVEANVGGLWGDNVWRREWIWLKPMDGETYAGKTLNLKFNQWYGEGRYYDPTTEEISWHGRSNPTIHMIDNVQMVVHHQINLPPTIDSLQTEGEQYTIVGNSDLTEIKLTGITDGGGQTFFLSKTFYDLYQITTATSYKKT